MLFQEFRRIDAAMVLVAWNIIEPFDMDTAVSIGLNALSTNGSRYISGFEKLLAGR